MTEPTRVAVLTPEGTGAIATVALIGPGSWNAARKRFAPASGRGLPEQAEEGATWFGRIGEGVSDEVVLSVPASAPQPRVEIHCHGGRQVVAWLMEIFRADGCVESSWQDLLPALTPPDGDVRAWALLPYAKTTRTAGIMLDQCHGAFRRAAQTISGLLDRGETRTAEFALRSLARMAPVGRHLIEPWKVAIVGAPNVGKSSLLNSLAGYQRSVVAPVPGTTRDVVTAALAFDGWLVEMADTAGLRDTTDELEQEGVTRACQTIAAADLCLWLLDTTAHPVGPTPSLIDEVGVSRENLLFVLTKIDQKPTWDLRGLPMAVRISSKHGDGIEELIQRLVRRLVPAVPAPGAAVPFTPELCDRVEEAYRQVRAGNAEGARGALAAA